MEKAMPPIAWTPTLRTRTLFLVDLSPKVKEADLRSLIGDEHITKVELNPKGTPGLRSHGTWVPRVLFKTFQSAESTCNSLWEHRFHRRTGRKIHLSPSSKGNSSTSVNALPRWIETQPIMYSADQLFDALRPFGPLLYVYPHTHKGGFVQFQNERDAQAAEDRAVVNGQRLILQPYDRNRLFCRNFPAKASAADIRTLFSEFGEISDTRVVYGPNGISRRYGFVTFKDSSDANCALQMLEQTIYEGSVITVDYARAKTKQQPRQTIPPFQKTQAETASVSPQAPAPQTSGEERHDGRSPEGSCLHCRKSKAEFDKLREDFKTVQIDRDTERESKVKAMESLNAQIEVNAGLEEEVEELQRQIELLQSRCKILVLEAHAANVKPSKPSNARFGGQRNSHTPTMDEKLRQAEIQESRRRMENLREEDERRKREKAEKEKEAREEMLRQERAAKIRVEMEKKEREAAERKRIEDERKREAEKRRLWQRASEEETERCRNLDASLWGHVSPWTAKAAFSRFRLHCDAFDSGQFSSSRPLTFHSIPWPILSDPFNDIVPEDLEWAMVEKFFAYVKLQIPNSEYKNLVQKAHRMFHPDRWRSRGVLETVFDPKIRASLDQAGNMVAQALTPIWSEARKS
ncbi:hypothetical protein HGRIS_009527 [Hohenbuehelia grisea]|uniref:RRM domain-containing protein n=1 Tax=Hohenbuehelia grisea TaxID=104357 RepID=A0ABR3J1G2_9AGAR